MNSFAIIIFIYVSILHVESKPANLTGDASYDFIDGKFISYKNKIGGATQ